MGYDADIYCRLYYEFRLMAVLLQVGMMIYAYIKHKWVIAYIVQILSIAYVLMGFIIYPEITRGYGGGFGDITGCLMVMGMVGLLLVSFILNIISLGKAQPKRNTWKPYVILAVILVSFLMLMGLRGMVLM